MGGQVTPVRVAMAREYLGALTQNDISLLSQSDRKALTDILADFQYSVSTREDLGEVLHDLGAFAERIVDQPPAASNRVVKVVSQIFGKWLSSNSVMTQVQNTINMMDLLGMGGQKIPLGLGGTAEIGPMVAVPANFRHTSFSLGGYTVDVGAMAHPDYNAEGIEETLKSLRSAGVVHLISLESRAHDEIQAYWENAGGGRAVLQSVEDFQPPSQELYDEVYDIVRAAAQNGEPCAIHCGEGWGRSGTVLASLKLREIIEDLMHDDPLAWQEYLDSEPQKSETVEMGHYSDVPSVATTPLVYRALMAVRGVDYGAGAGNDQSTHGSSVENEAQVGSLVELEARIRQDYMDTGFLEG